MYVLISLSFTFAVVRAALVRHQCVFVLFPSLSSMSFATKGKESACGHKCTAPPCDMPRKIFAIEDNASSSNSIGEMVRNVISNWKPILGQLFNGSH